MFREHAVGHSDDLGGDPISGPSSSRKPAVDDHVIAFSNDQARLVLQRRWRAPNQIEQAVAPRRDVRAVLNQDYSRTLAHSISATGQSDTDVSNAARATMKLLARARTSCPAVSSLTTLTVLRQQIRSCPTGLVAARVDQPPPDQARSALRWKTPTNTTAEFSASRHTRISPYMKKRWPWRGKCYGIKP
jgi:hypothetical protein